MAEHSSMGGQQTYTVSVNHGGESYEIGRVDIPAGATPQQAQQKVAALLRRLATEVEAEQMAT